MFARKWNEVELPDDIRIYRFVFPVSKLQLGGTDGGMQFRENVFCVFVPP